MSYGELYGTRTGYFVQEEHSLVSIEDAWIAEARPHGVNELLQSLERCLCISLHLSSSMKAGDAEDQNGMLFKVGSHKELTKKIIEYSKNKKKFKKKTEPAFNSLYKYDLKSNLNEYYFQISKLC